MISHGREPRRIAPISPPVPVILARHTVPVDLALENAVLDEDARAVNWLTANWMPQEAFIRRKRREDAMKAIAGGV